MAHEHNPQYLSRRAYHSQYKDYSGIFYGNGVLFYFLCNDCVSERVTNAMRLHYVIWPSLMYMRHQAVYCNITYRKLMWLNGRGLDQMEFVVRMVSDVPLGIDATGRAFTVHTKLFFIRNALLMFPY